MTMMLDASSGRFSPRLLGGTRDIEAGVRAAGPKGRPAPAQAKSPTGDAGLGIRHLKAFRSPNGAAQEIDHTCGPWCRPFRAAVTAFATPGSAGYQRRKAGVNL